MIGRQRTITNMERRRIWVTGIVQGVGFRPFIYGLATCRGLVGSVWNDASGVIIEVEGNPSRLDDFIIAVEQNAPPLANVERIRWETVPRSDHLTKFFIAESETQTDREVFVSPDTALCDDCWQEMLDPNDRRYRYPFINCTNCGPRFTIIRDVPYDRHQTTMAAFTMCPDCQREYDDPLDRRFHAQPNACPLCGPQVKLFKTDGDVIDGDQAITTAVELLIQGRILAIKGLGGYHLACDASSEQAVNRLRQRKHRWDKPFALMAPNIETVEALCYVNQQEHQLLTSQQRPIVLLQTRSSAGQYLGTAVAPGQYTLGMMLPYTPLHVLLLQVMDRVLVMTSGNQSDEPIAYVDDDARQRLGAIADAFLSHNRDIHMRCDDSVVRVVADKTIFLRRSRGYAPQPLSLDVEFERPVLAVGAHLKNIFCLGRSRHAFLSHHIGDLENLETLTSFTHGIDHFQRLFGIEPAIIAHDMHPDYLSTQWAQGNLRSSPSEIELVSVQHHHAHIASVMVEHGLTEPVIGLAFDGTGYGPDGTVWGGEVLVADYTDYRRVACLTPVAMPGGEQAIRQPWRMAAAYLYQTYGNEFEHLPLDFVARLNQNKWPTLKHMIDRRVNAPLTSSMGRLFDAIAALIGLRDEVNYEGQAAVELETLAIQANDEGEYPFELVEMNVDETMTPGQKISSPTDLPSIQPGFIETRPLIQAIVTNLQQGVPESIIAARFHNTIARMSLAVCEQLHRETGLTQVALSGGVFQNAYLLEKTVQKLKSSGFKVYLNNKVPPNDGGLALGQAVIAAAQLGNLRFTKG